MTSDDHAAEATTRARLPRRTVAGVSAFGVALALLVVSCFLPTDYVLEEPGPVYNTIGEVTTADDEIVPLISVSGADTYDTSGALDLTTVQVRGDREHRISWVQLALAWFDRSTAILPIDSVYPQGETAEQRDAENAVMMTDSQSAASAAALLQLGYDVPAQLTVAGLVDGSPAEGILQEGDVITAAGGEALESTDDLRSRIADLDGAPVALTIDRDGEEQQVEVTPTKQEIDGSESWALGVSLTESYDLPIDVTIQLDDVGGPSAGMMFALGIIDELTPGEMTGGEHIAGTGTITADGAVGAIGGIRQKLYGASRDGADYFIAPASNCDEVVGHIPDGLQVTPVSTLDEAEQAVEAIADGNADSLPACTAG
ncbi:YlbL family protein [Microbacterium indicum]|uniref:YlbL family protein n=1 Tax=Microbacterium indicum TaxID=358100 RepID=UPI000402F85F|nr:S16 family serine protease [Microbacterium indicum]